MLKGKGKEADLYSAFIEVPYTQGAQTYIPVSFLFSFKKGTHEHNANHALTLTVNF